MKKTITLTIAASVVVLLACKKENSAPPQQKDVVQSPTEKCGPYGKNSSWKSIGGDTLFSENLTLTYFFTESHSPCNICYYQQNISFWNDYDYTFPVSECAVANDTLIFTDIDSGRKAIFKRNK